MLRPHRRRPLFESLENRRLLAHNIGHNPGGGIPHQGDPIEVVGGVLTIVGTSKSDRIVVSSDGTNVTATFNKATFTSPLAGITSISIDGAGGNDRIDIAGSVALDATITGGSGNDRIHGGAGIDDITGDAGNDWLWGGDGDDSLDAGAGNDHVFGELGADTMLAGAGNDEMDGGAGNDNLDGEAGHDRLRGGLGDDLIFGGAGKDQLRGDDGNDFLDGGDDKDHLLGGNGDDILLGGAGNDQLDGGAGSNQLDGGEGTDKLKNGTEVDLSAVLLAPLTGPLGSGSASFAFTIAEGSAEFELNISVTGGPLSSPLPVSVNGTPVGTLTTDAAGNGTLVLSTNPNQPDEVLLAGVTIVAGSTISVGDLTGTFALV
jgi:Ca2+-binding RTX toxin-like protein